MIALLDTRNSNNNCRGIRSTEILSKSSSFWIYYKTVHVLFYHFSRGMYRNETNKLLLLYDNTCTVSVKGIPCWTKSNVVIMLILIICMKRNNVNSQNKKAKSKGLEIKYPGKIRFSYWENNVYNFDDYCLA